MQRCCPRFAPCWATTSFCKARWCTKQPAHGKPGGYHQDGSGVYEFRKLGHAHAAGAVARRLLPHRPVREDMGNMVMIPGSHNITMTLPEDGVPAESDLPITRGDLWQAGRSAAVPSGCVSSHRRERRATSIVTPCTWCIRRRGWCRPTAWSNNTDFLERTTPLRRSLLGEWKRARGAIWHGL